MIFDSEYVTELVKEWRSTKDEELLAEILEAARSLIEAIASSFDPYFREDLIQEAFVKVQYAITYFDPDISNLHTYLTTVIRNSCISFVRKFSKEVLVVEDYMLSVPTYDSMAEREIISVLISRNRDRFPSIPVDDVDGATEFVYYAIRDGIKGKSRGTVACLIRVYGWNRRVATVFYHSSMIFLRALLADKFSIVEGYEGNTEFTLLPELENIVGTQAYERILLLFSGTYVKIP